MLRKRGGCNCAYRGCTNNTSNTPGISFFRFPKDTDRCASWITASGRQDLKNKNHNNLLYNNYRVCQEHFENHHFLNDLKNRLQSHACPRAVNPIVKTEIQNENNLGFESTRMTTTEKEHSIGKGCNPLDMHIQEYLMDHDYLGMNFNISSQAEYKNSNSSSTQALHYSNTKDENSVDLSIGPRRCNNYVFSIGIRDRRNLHVLLKRSNNAVEGTQTVATQTHKSLSNNMPRMIRLLKNVNALQQKVKRMENSRRLREGTKARLTASQSHVLCSFFEENPEVIKGYRKLSKCREAVQSKWKKISPQLNSLGPPRDHKAWAKYLCDLKAKLKRKRIKWRQNSNGTGPIICNADDFNEIELRMLQVLRKELPNSQDIQDTNTSDNEMEESSSNVDDDCDNIFPFQDSKNEEKKINISSFTELQSNDTPPPDSYTRQMFFPRNEYNDEFDTFGRNIAQQLRTLPLATALETQEILLSVMRKQRIKTLNVQANGNNDMDPLDK